MYDAHTRNLDAAPAAVFSHDPWWHYAATCATALQCGYQPPSIGVAGPVLVAGKPRSCAPQRTTVAFKAGPATTTNQAC